MATLGSVVGLRYWMEVPLMLFDKHIQVKNPTWCRPRLNWRGSTVLYRHPNHQTVLSKDPVEPIIPLAWLVVADYRITWRRDNIVIHHNTRGPLRCGLQGGCPVMARKEGLELLSDLEKMQHGGMELGATELSWWAEKFPEVPMDV
jgi:hypothetical protein